MIGTVSIHATQLRLFFPSKMAIWYASIFDFCVGFNLGIGIVELEAIGRRCDSRGGNYKAPYSEDTYRE